MVNKKIHIDKSKYKTLREYGYEQKRISDLFRILCISFLTPAVIIGGPTIAVLFVKKLLILAYIFSSIFALLFLAGVAFCVVWGVLSKRFTNVIKNKIYGPLDEPLEKIPNIK